MRGVCGVCLCTVCDVQFQENTDVFHYRHEMFISPVFSLLSRLVCFPRSLALTLQKKLRRYFRTKKLRASNLLVRPQSWPMFGPCSGPYILHHNKGTPTYAPTACLSGSSSQSSQQRIISSTRRIRSSACPPHP